MNPEDKFDPDSAIDHSLIRRMGQVIKATSGEGFAFVTPYGSTIKLGMRKNGDFAVLVDGKVVLLEKRDDAKDCWVQTLVPEGVAPKPDPEYKGYEAERDELLASLSPHDRERAERAFALPDKDFSSREEMLEEFREAIRGLQSTDDPRLVLVHDQLVATYLQFKHLKGGAE